MKDVKLNLILKLLEQSCMMNMKSSRTNSRMITFEFLCAENVKIFLHSGKIYQSSIFLEELAGKRAILAKHSFV